MHMKNTKSRHTLTNAAVAAALAILATALYIWTIRYPFLWDDKYLVINNPFIRTLSNLPLLLTKKYFTQDIELSYRPMGTLILFINYAIGNIWTEPYRITMILLHTANSFLVYRFCVTLRTHLSEPEQGFDWRAFAAAAIFAAHPINTEAIMGVTFVEDPLCLTFMLLGIISYAKWRGGRRWGFFALSALCMAFGVLTKETGVVFPAIVILWEILYFMKKGAGFRIFKSAAALVPFGIVALGYLALRFRYMTNPIEHISGRGRGALPTLLLSTRAFVHYVSLSALPIRQCIDYFYTGPSPTLRMPQFLICLVLSAAFLLLPFALMRRNKAAVFALLWYIIFLLPVSNIIPMTVIMAERYVYISMAGFLAALAMVVPAPSVSALNEGPSGGTVPPFLWAAVLVCITGILFYAAFQRNKVWSSDVALWHDACECSPESPYSYVNLSSAYINDGKLGEAESVLFKGVSLAIVTDPTKDRYGNLFRAYGNLGVVYIRENRLKAAEFYLRKSLALAPGYANARFNLGMVLQLSPKPGALWEAINEYEKGLSAAPTNVTNRKVLIGLYEKTGDYSMAASHYRKLAEIDNANRDEYLRQAERLEKKITGKSN